MILTIEIKLDVKSGVPFYRQVIDQVKAAIATESLSPGDRLPTVRQLAVDLSINPNTVSRAYTELELTPVSRWRLVAGLRVDYTQAIERFVVSPRFNTRVDVTDGFPRTTLKGGVGVFTQPPQPHQSGPPLGT